MRDQMQDGMAEATRLTRESRLAEATAVIQRVLGGSFATMADDAQGNADEPTEASFRVLDEAPRTKANECRRATGRRPAAATQSAPESPIRFRSVPDMSGALPGIMPGAAERVSAPSVVPAGGRFIER